MDTKICTRCGQELTLDHFYSYTLKRGRHKTTAECKDCACERTRRFYANHKRVPIKLDTQGRPVKGHKLYWGEQTMKDFIRLFPVTSNADLAIRFRCNDRTIRSRAKEMQLKKSTAYLSQTFRENGKIGQLKSKLKWL